MSELPELTDQLRSEALFEIFKQQLAKDFEQSNFPFDFIQSLKPDYDSLVSTIVGQLMQTEKRSDVSLMNLLYRIDISESQLNSYLSRDKSRTTIEVIGELIIKRVLQKVVIKQYYKLSNDKSGPIG